MASTESGSCFLEISDEDAEQEEMTANIHSGDEDGMPNMHDKLADSSETDSQTDTSELQYKVQAKGKRKAGKKGTANSS